MANSGRNTKKQHGGSSDFMGLFYANTAVGGPAAISQATLQGINNAPMFNPLSTNSAVPGNSTGIVPTGTYLATHTGGGSRRQRGSSCCAGGSANQRGGAIIRNKRQLQEIFGNNNPLVSVQVSVLGYAEGETTTDYLNNIEFDFRKHDYDVILAQYGGSVKDLRTECNNRGLSCRGTNGKYLPKAKLVKLLDQHGGAFNGLYAMAPPSNQPTFHPTK